MKRTLCFVFIIVFVFMIDSTIFAEEYPKFKSGDLVKYNNIAFYVMFDSSKDEDSVQLLKMVPLTHDEINEYTDNKAYLYRLTDGTKMYNKSDDNEFYGNMAFYYGDDCLYIDDDNRSIVTTNCKNDYVSSNVKKVVDSWIEKNFNVSDIVNFEDGLKSRLLNSNDLNLICPNDSWIHTANSNCPKWITQLNYYSWTMEMRDHCVYTAGSERCVRNAITETVPAKESYFKGTYVFNGGSVRPTIKLKKSAISKVGLYNEYNNNRTREYKIGDVINYNDTKFYVIKNSKEEDDTVTLLKDNPLTEYEIKKYGSGHINNYVLGVDPGEVIGNDEFPMIAYLSTNNCYYLGIYFENDYVMKERSDYSGCSANYDTSDIKYVVDNWVMNTISSDDLSKDSSGYSARLINRDDLLNLAYINIQTDTMNEDNFKASNDTPYFMMNKNTRGMLTMIEGFNNQNGISLSVADSEYNFTTRNLPMSTVGTVRPVVILKKQAITNKITNVEEIEDSDNIEVTIETEVNNNQVVSVSNTLLNNRIIFIIIGTIISTLSVILFVYLSKKKK